MDGAPQGHRRSDANDAERRLRSLIETIPAITYIDELADFTPIFVSPQIETVLGVPVDRFLREDLWEGLVHPDDRERAVREYREAQVHAGTYVSEYRLVATDGRVVSIRDIATVIDDGQGRPARVLGVMFDVTAEVERESALREVEDRYRSLLSNLPVGFYTEPPDDVTGVTTFVSPHFEEITGRPSSFWTDGSGSWTAVVHPDDLAAFIEADERSIASDGRFRMEYRVVRPDGSEIWVHDEAVMIHDEAGTPVRWEGFLLDITERKRAEEQAAFLAFHDAVTGLPNRTTLEQVAEPILKRAERERAVVAVVAVDLDDLKLVNESLGHDAGDAVLRHLATVLGGGVRGSDVVARPGGGEFLVLMPGSPGSLDDETGRSVDDAAAFATRILSALNEPIHGLDAELYPTASIGIAFYPKDGSQLGSLVRAANGAVRRSRQNGPGRFAFASADGAEATARLGLANRLRRATDAGEEWELHFQPIVELSTARCVSVEALLRWRGPDGTLVPPMEFIPLAEDLGLMETIGDWVAQACSAQLGAWREAGLDLTASFNVSARQFRRGDLVERFVMHAHAAGVEPRRLTVEVTESTAMADPERVRRALDELREAGFRLAIDDFGTGYSSLSRLHEVGADLLKIDRSFVSRLPRDDGIVDAMIQIARSLSMDVVAEGIETLEQRGYLADRSVVLGQGYLFSKPAPAEELESGSISFAEIADRLHP